MILLARIAVGMFAKHPQHAYDLILPSVQGGFCQGGGQAWPGCVRQGHITPQCSAPVLVHA